MKTIATTKKNTIGKPPKIETPVSNKNGLNSKQSPAKLHVKLDLDQESYLRVSHNATHSRKKSH